MLSEDSFHYAIENTHVIVEPQQRIATFGSTHFRFHLITELMDHVNEVRVREGSLHAERPRIISPGHMAHLTLENFGEKARDFADWLEHQSEQFTFLKYGFQVRKSDVTERLVSSSVEKVIERVRGDVREEDEPISAIIQGVDEGWEVCLLKFTMDMVNKSSGGNLGDFRQRGLI